MSATIWGVIGGIITLAIGILSEFFSAQARERKEQEAFDKQDLEFRVLAQKALEKIYARTAEAAKGSQTVQDRLDKHMNAPGSNDAKQ